MQKNANALVLESSPYLRQHAYNPVHWVPWSQDAFEQAKQENKLVLVSIGYSSCHWCHVMENECFEDVEVAELMNRHFVNIKVDREERPDIDQVYMNAVQLMTQRGGWPLNCFVLPDGRPIYGGTYFPKENWMHILRSLHHTYTHDPQKTEEYASLLTDGIRRADWIGEIPETVSLDKEKLHELVVRWAHGFDTVEGGTNKAPKFPMPDNLSFLMKYAHFFEDGRVSRHVFLTLEKMAMGGIYDQIGGGFCRYSVDILWKVPHFEKMLYDNAQLLGVYAKAYVIYQDPLFLRILKQSLNWLNREMKDPSGGYYSAIDADSEGEEGRFYCWSEEEFDEVTGNDANWADFYSINDDGLWEGKYIPLRKKSDASICAEWNISQEELDEGILEINDLLLHRRNTRIRPLTDDKCLTSWNALMLIGFCEAYISAGDESYRKQAVDLGHWIEQNMLTDDRLKRCYHQGKSYIDGFLDDYANCISAFIHLHQVSADERWLHHAFKLTEYVMNTFSTSDSPMFYYTPKETELVARKMEIHDNVLPASNSVMAENLFILGQLFLRMDWVKKSKQMVLGIYDGMETYGSAYSRWANVLMMHISPYHIICGKKDSFPEWRGVQMSPDHQVLFCSGLSLPIMESKTFGGESTFYVCLSNGSCLSPVGSVNELWGQLEKPFRDDSHE